MGRLQDALEVDVEGSIVARSEPSAEKETPKVLLALAATFERLVLRNERCLGNLAEHRKLTIFHGSRAPNVNILKYLQRIHKYTNCSPSCFVVGFIYIDHLIHKQPDLPLISLNVHRLLITSIMVATKHLDDVHYNNAFYARVGGISNAELNSLEIDFLFRLDFRLQVTLHVFEGYCTHLEKEMLLAGPRIDSSLPITASFPIDHNERKNIIEDAQRRLRLSLSHNSPPVVAATTIEHPESPEQQVYLQ